MDINQILQSVDRERAENEGRMPVGGGVVNNADTVNNNVSHSSVGSNAGNNPSVSVEFTQDIAARPPVPVLMRMPVLLPLEGPIPTSEELAAAMNNVNGCSGDDYARAMAEMAAAINAMPDEIRYAHWPRRQPVDPVMTGALLQVQDKVRLTGMQDILWPPIGSRSPRKLREFHQANSRLISKLEGYASSVETFPGELAAALSYEIKIIEN